MKKKKIVLLVVVGVLIGAVFIWRDGTTEETFSVHDLNWDDYEGMNERVSSLTLHIPPHFMDRFVETHLDLTGLFLLFSENQHLLRDRPGTAGLTLDSDFEVVLEFTNLLGNETFLDGAAVYDTSFYISFYVDRSLAQESLDLVGAAVRAYHSAQDPEVRITLAEVDWDSLRGGYEEYISRIIIQGLIGEGVQFNMFDFENGRDDLSLILGFLEDNQDDFRSVGDSEYTYQGAIHFHWVEDQPRLLSTFFMNEELNRRLMGVIGEEAWERARR